MAPSKDKSKCVSQRGTDLIMIIRFEQSFQLFFEDIYMKIKVNNHELRTDPKIRRAITLILIIFFLLYTNTSKNSFLFLDQYTGVEPVVIVAATYTPWSILERLESATSAFVVGWAGLEPATPALSERCSNLLSYQPIFNNYCGIIFTCRMKLN